MNRSDIKKKVNVKQQFGSNVTRTSSHGISFSSRVSRAGGSRNNLVANGSRWNVGGDSKSEKTSNLKPVVQVLDDMGNDVTPRSLLTLDANAIKRVTSDALFGSDSIVTPSELGQSIYAASNASFMGGFSRSVMGSTSASGWSSPESISEDLTEPGGRRYDIQAGIGDIKRKYAPVKEDLTISDLDKMVDITISETDTIWLLDIPGVSVCQESDIAQTIIADNLRYAETLKTRPGNDSFVERGMQTFNDDPKNKEMQTIPVHQNDVGCMATTWDMHDVYTEVNTDVAVVEDGVTGAIDSLSRPTSARKSDSVNEEEDSVTSQSVRDGSAMSGSILTASHASIGTKASEDEAGVTKEQKKDQGENENEEIVNDLDNPILKSCSLRKDLFTMERVLSSNSFQPRQAKYRGFRELKECDQNEEATTALMSELGPSLEKLWSYSCGITKGRNVSCIAWNKLNPDIVAVGYGEFEFSHQKSGIACCWSLKNPEYPERVFHVQSGVMSLDFSDVTPNLLAIGLYDGTIVIYNVRNTDNSPVLDSLESEGKHTAPVWHVKWITRDQNNGEEKDEILVSVAADGRVTKWTIRKGFECADLMKLKRISVGKPASKKGTPLSSTKKSDALISRYSAGFCFDFHPEDTNVYIVGTEEGHIHKCSCSYNEQYLETYDGHTGPVYEIKWSPFLPDVFLSCSADWSVKLWHQDCTTPILTFTSSTKSTNGICWSPFSSSVFGCVNEGAVEIWDVAQSTLDPLVVHTPLQDVKLSAISFANNSDSVLVGESDGQVHVYLLNGIKRSETSQADVLKSVITPLIAKEISSSRG